MCLQKDPLITRFVWCSLILSSHLILQRQHQKSMSPLCVRGQKKGPDVSPKEPSDHNIILGSSILQKHNTLEDKLTNQRLPSLFLDTNKTQDGPEMSPKEPLDHKILSVFLDAVIA